MSGPVYAIEVVAWDDALSGTRTLTFATGTGFVTGAADTPASTHFVPCVIDAGNFSQFLVDALLTDGRSRVGFGEIVLNNADGSLDALNTYGLDGRAVTVRTGVAGDAYPEGWTALLTGTVEQAEFGWDTVRLLIRDRQAEVADRPFQAVKFGGSNEGSPLDGVWTAWPVTWPASRFPTCWARRSTSRRRS
jgi:hypothetical protein